MPTTSNFGWTTPADTDLVKDGALAIRTLGNGIDTSFLDLKGGTTDQVLAKNSNTDLDFKWVAQDDADAIQKSLIDAEGDLIVGDAADAVQRLAIGSNGNVLTVDTSVDGKIKWAAPAAGGKVLQVVSSTATTFQGIKSASAVDVTNMSISITPSSVSSKVLITGMLNGVDSQTATKQRTVLRLVDGSNISLYCILDDDSPTSSGPRLNIPFTYLHSPASTSALTYKLRVTNDTSAQGIYVNNNFTVNITSSIVAMEIGA